MELFHQSELFAHFLRERNYRHPIFQRIIFAFLYALQEDDRRLLRQPVSRSLAEPRKKLARCLRMKGESGQAKMLYEDVLPVFIEKHGAGHPKTQEVRQCLQELTDKS